MNRPRSKAARHSFWSSLIVASVLAINGGCADPPRTAGEPDPLAEAPGWVTQGCRVYWRDQKVEANVVCGIGTAGPDRNPLAARETAIARARSAIARSVEVTIESLVRLQSGRNASNDGDLRTIVHQLTSTSLPASRVESIWQTGNGEVFALVSLRVAKLQQSLRRNHKLSPAAREDLALKTADAFAEMNAALDTGPDEDDPRLGREIEQ